MEIMKRYSWTAVLLVFVLFLTGCRAAESISEPATSPEAVVVKLTTEADEEETGEETEEETTEEETETEPEEELIPARIPTKVKGVYVTAYVAGTQSAIDDIIQHIDETEVNAVVIDVKDDSGRVTFAMDMPMVNELGSVSTFIPDIDSLMAKLKEHNIYTIARIVAFRDPYLPEQRPDLALQLEDGTVYRDKQNLAWINPYKTEVWDYLIEVAKGAHEAGFDEVQFDYIRFCTEGGVKDVVYDEEDTKGRGKTEIITEFVKYAYEQLSEEGVYMAADVFGTIIGGGIDSDNVGQSYGEMAQSLDYICPMIYPSHYADGNFGIEHPDTQPYDTILAALKKSKADLANYGDEGDLAVVRPWLQDFTASYLANYITYGDAEVRAEIQAVYDAGYDEWLLWSAANKYNWTALKTPEEAEEEQREIAESRAALEAEAQAEAEAEAQRQAAEETSPVSEEGSEAGSNEGSDTEEDDGEQ